MKMGKSLSAGCESDAASVVIGKRHLERKLAVLLELARTVSCSPLLAPHPPEVDLNHLSATSGTSMRLCAAIVKKTSGKALGEFVI